MIGLRTRIDPKSPLPAPVSSERVRVVVQYCTVFDEISELLLKRKRWIEDRVRNNDSGSDHAGVDQIEARFSLRFQSWVKTQSIS